MWQLRKWIILPLVSKSSAQFQRLLNLSLKGNSRAHLGPLTCNQATKSSYWRVQSYSSGYCSTMVATGADFRDISDSTITSGVLVALSDLDLPGKDKKSNLNGQSVTPAGQDGSEALLIACCIALGEHILHLCLQLTNFLPLPSNLRYQGGIMGLYGDQPVLRFLVLVRKRLETEETSNLEREHWHQRPAQPCSLWEEEPTHTDLVQCNPVTRGRDKVGGHCVVTFYVGILRVAMTLSTPVRQDRFILDGTGKWVSWEQEAACSRTCNTGYDVIVDECCSSGDNRVCLTVPWNIVKPMLTTCTDVCLPKQPVMIKL
ncbi:hypothetical protein MAR_019829 [Mya arenaria]|uniref:Uncharacterized protein n=1 Tax=Mya arenaria TaxID=6604 RepID=A0ABY7E377_MYAAR|nr:hypothetical protein MAR_019829 [Mya arenaria]